jgi:hypothetical protein
MATKRRTDPLTIDVTDDLSRVDQVMTHILKDRASWGDFLRDPNGVFVRLGLHPPTSPEINERVNRVFYATLTNRRLLRLLLSKFKSFRPRQLKAVRRDFAAGLAKGRIQYNTEFDLESLDHVVRDTKTLREALRLSLHDLNNMGILRVRHTTKEIDDYVAAVTEAVRKRQPIEAHPKLEVWDRNYGVGKPFGAAFVEVGTLVTTVATVESAAVATAIAVAVATAVVAVQVEAVVDGEPPIVAALEAAALGNAGSLNAIATLGRLLDLSGELLVHAQTFERRARS